MMRVAACIYASAIHKALIVLIDDTLTHFKNDCRKQLVLGMLATSLAQLYHKIMCQEMFEERGLTFLTIVV